jgi:long-chain acyl-CoA synthetase
MVDQEPETLVELLCQAAAKRPTAEVIRFKRDKVWVGIRGEELLSRVQRVALALAEIGVGRGDKVAILAESGPLWSITDYAILSNGAVNVPLYPTQPVHQVEYILEDSKPKLLFVSTARQMRRVNEALQKFPDLRVITFQSGVEGENVSAFEELERRGETLVREQPGAFEALISDVKADDLASVIYTSGTTGEPKGAMLTHGNIVFNTLAAGRFLGIEEGGVMLSYLPLSHIFERMVLYLCLHFGVQINYARGIETVASDMKDVHPTLMSTVPRMLEKVYSRMQKSAGEGSGLKKKAFEWSLSVGKSWARLASEGEPIPPMVELKREIADRLVFGKLREAVGGRIGRMVSGGAALPCDIAMVFIGAGIPVLQGYGLTETSPVIAVNTREANRIGAVGKVLPGVDLVIAEDGEILTRGPHVFQGYFNKPEETGAAFTDQSENGSRWFRTGDIGYLDEDGFLFITDRKKDLIKTSAGKYVAPQMIERLIGQSEYVEQAVVVGDKRKFVSALIVPEFAALKSWAKSKAIEAAGNQELIADRRVVELMKGEVNRLTRELADYEKVKRIALLAEEFTIEGGELTPTLKVKRKVVEQKYGQLIDSLYGSDPDSEK